MTPVAKPTLYRNVQFRSRLEARWAAFFDLAGWRWNYEPFDLPQWTPDFALKGACNTVLVEVKPIEWAGADAEQILQREDVAKVLAYRSDDGDSEAFKDELLILGNGPQRVGADIVIGAFVDEAWGEAPDWAVLCRGDDFGKTFDFCARNGAYAYRMSGGWDGNAHLEHVNDNTAHRAWREAGNLTQWNPAEEYKGPIGPVLDRVVSRLKGGDA